MAVHQGRGFAAIEYPTGMNQNGDPSQAWIKVKPDGRIDVFAGTSDIGNGSKTIQSQIVAETIGVPYEWVTYDNSNTDSSPVCTGTFASRATFVAGKAVEKAAEKGRQKLLEIAGKELEIDPADLEIVDGEVLAKGAPQKKISSGRDAASFGSSWRRLPAAAFLGLTNVFSPFSAAMRFISLNPGMDMKTSPRASSSPGGAFPASRSGTLLMVRMLWVTSSPTLPSPRVAATSSNPFR